METRRGCNFSQFYSFILYVILCHISSTQEQSHIATIQPNFGPEAGGTMVTITSTHFDVIHITQVLTADQECVLAERSSTGVVCTIGSRYSWMQLNTPLNVTLHVLGGQKYTLPGAFTYRLNPVISDISPLFSILSGGILLTISGRNLNSVSSISFVIHTSVNGNITGSAVSEPCANQYSQNIICPTPKVEIPTQMTSLQSLVSAGSHEISNGGSLKFYTGFDMSGFHRYKEMITVLPAYSEIKIYKDPKINRFKDGIYNHKPSHGQILNIRGTYLNPPLSERDFRISIANSYCKIINMSSTVLNCQMPERTSIGSSPKMAHRFPVQVIIGTGKLNFTLGTLVFTSDIWSGAWPVVAGVLGIAALVLGILAAVIIHYVPRRKN